MSEWAADHLLGKLFPFWKALRDDEFGGFYGNVSFDLVTDKKADKGCILNSRITWFFSNIYLLYKEGLLSEEKFKEYGVEPEDVLLLARHGYSFMKDRCIDPVNGGVFWSVDYQGMPSDTTKHTYNQAFAIYALSAYYDASGDVEALELAKELLDVVENKCRDDIGYLEAQNADFTPAENDKLSENGVIADRTMNTLLHVFEAYSGLYKVSRDERVRNLISYISEVFADKIYSPELHRQNVFFDNDYNSIIDLHSYGHDIETAWLVDKGVDAACDDALKARIHAINEDLTSQIYKVAFDGRSLPAECENGVVNERRDWWVQAETVLGFLNGFLRDQSHTDYLDAAIHQLDFIKEYVFDKRNGSEWFYRVDKDGNPDPSEAMAEEWKCPYHNGRMCMELIRANATGKL